LNSLWGFFGQQENKLRTTIIRDPATLHNLLTSPTVEVASILPVNDDILYVSTRYKEIAHESLNTANVVIAAFVTAQARLKLYSYLEQLGHRAKYVDTDSIIYVSDLRLYEPPIGPLLGDLTNELSSYGENTYITCLRI